MMPDSFVSDILLPALYSILSVLVPIVAGFVIDALRKWGAKQKAEWVRALMAEVADAADRAVRMTEQTFAGAKRNEQGKLDARSAREAFNKSVQAAASQLGQGGMKSLQKIAGGESQASEIIGVMVEAAVEKRKPQRSSSEFLGG